MVSICIATYNGEEYLYNTLKSIQNQSYSDFECILVDDHSTDNTVNILLSFAKKDNRFKVFVNCTDKNNPYVDSHNKSYEYATGDLLFRFDQDDIMKQNYIQYYIDYMNNNIDCDAVSTYPVFYQLIDWKPSVIEFITQERMIRDSKNFNNDALLTYKDIYDAWFNQTSCLRKSFYDKFKPKFKYTKNGDILFWWNVLSYGAIIKTCPVQLMYQIHRPDSAYFSELYNSVIDENKFQLDAATYKLNSFLIAYEKFHKPEYLNCIEVFRNTVNYFQKMINEHDN